MSTTTIRIDQRTHAVLAALAREQQTTITAVIDQAAAISKIASGGNACARKSRTSREIPWRGRNIRLRSAPWMPP